MRTSVYLKINENYTATIYSLEDLKAYLKFEGVTLETLEFHKPENQNEDLAAEIKEWFDSENKVQLPVHSKRTLNTLERRMKKAIEMNEEYSSLSCEEDDPDFWDNWNLDQYHREIFKLGNKYEKASKAVKEYIEKNQIGAALAQDMFSTLQYNMNVDLCTDVIDFFDLEFCAETYS